MPAFAVRPPGQDHPGGLLAGLRLGFHLLGRLLQPRWQFVLIAIFGRKSSHHRSLPGSALLIRRFTLLLSCRLANLGTDLLPLGLLAFFLRHLVAARGGRRPAWKKHVGAS